MQQGKKTPAPAGGFWRNVLPSMFSQLISATFVVVDGFFIGHNMGDAGLAAINVSWPVVQLMQAVGLALGTGGAVCMATALGGGDRALFGRARANTLLALCGGGLLLGLGFYAALPVLLPHMGADARLQVLAGQYLRLECAFSVVQVAACGVVPLLRGAGKAMAAMWTMTLGLGGNILLDWYIIERLQGGIRGAAAATLISQGASAALGLWLLLRPAGRGQGAAQRPARPAIKPDLRLMARIARLGTAVFGITASVSVIVLLNNLQAQAWGGSGAVAVYAVLSYATGVYVPLIGGVGDGLQPLVSYANGARDLAALTRLRRQGLAAALAVSLGCAGLCWLSRRQFPPIMGAGPAVTAGAAGALCWVALALPFLAEVRFSCSYFTALGRARAAGALAYGESVLVQPMFLFSLPLWFGIAGVWAAYPASELACAALAAVLMARAVRQLKAG